MPLNKQALQDGIEALAGAKTGTEAAAGWADALQAHFSGVVPASTTVAAATATFEVAMTAIMNGTDPASTITSLEAAFLAFATAVGLGMAPTFAGLPPPAPVGISALAAVMSTDVAASAAAWATAIDLWSKLGTATLVAPPFTPTTWT